MRKHLSFTLIIFTVALFIGCSEYSKVLKNGDNEAKKEFAIKSYDEGKYIQAITLLEEIIPFYKLTIEGEDLYFMYCMANYQLEDYYLSGYYFRRFVRQYPNSPKVEEALFLSALCSVHNSPEYHLDQTETLNALDQMQIFVDLYPNSTRIDTCNIIMDNLRGKLELKKYNNAMLYYNTGHYGAAVVALNSTLEEYPNTPHKEDILYYLVKSHYKLAINSVQYKKEERLNDTIKSINKFVATFPESKRINEIESIRKNTETELKNFGN